MLYSEFLENTKAKDTAYNYRVYRQLEALYMENDSITKADLYTAAMKLIDNSPTEAEKEAEKLKAEARKQSEESKSIIDHYNERIETYKLYMEISDPGEAKSYKESIKAYKEQIKKEKAWIAKQKFFLSLA